MCPVSVLNRWRCLLHFSVNYGDGRGEVEARVCLCSPWCLSSLTADTGNLENCTTISDVSRYHSDGGVYVVRSRQPDGDVDVGDCLRRKKGSRAAEPDGIEVWGGGVHECMCCKSAG